jgi:hypothetical protein
LAPPSSNWSFSQIPHYNVDATPAPNWATGVPWSHHQPISHFPHGAPNQSDTEQPAGGKRRGKIKRVAFVTWRITWRPIAALQLRNSASPDTGSNRGCRANVGSKPVKGFVAGALSSYGPRATLGFGVGPGFALGARDLPLEKLPLFE